MAPYDPLLGGFTLVFVVALMAFGLWRGYHVKTGDPDYAWWSVPGHVVPPFVEKDLTDGG